MDSFLHNHQSELDNFMEDKAIQDLEDAGIYPDPRDYPDNDAVMEALYEDVRNEFPDAPDSVIEDITQKRFEELPEPGDYND
tara:strand:+ start:446 stop:691 length:246 start_codon:yes stop_codon:yes gene_type:complete